MTRTSRNFGRGLAAGLTLLAVGAVVAGAKLHAQDEKTGGGQGGPVIGKEYGRTPFSGMPLQVYEQQRGKRQTLNASEYHAVTQGYLRESVCMAQCNVYIQLLKEPKLRQAMETYRKDVCEPNLAEMASYLQAGGYKLPLPYNAVTDAKGEQELGRLETAAIDDKQILIGHVFAVEGFMNRWNQGAVLSERAEVRDAFVRNWHRANRWHLATKAMAEQMGFLAPEPEIK